MHFLDNKDVNNDNVVTIFPPRLSFAVSTVIFSGESDFLVNKIAREIRDHRVCDCNKPDLRIIHNYRSDEIYPNRYGNWRTGSNNTSPMIPLLLTEYPEFSFSFGRMNFFFHQKHKRMLIIVVQHEN